MSSVIAEVRETRDGRRDGSIEIEDGIECGDGRQADKQRCEKIWELDKEMIIEMGVEKILKRWEKGWE